MPQPKSYPRDAYRDVAELLSPQAVSAYLANRGWRLESGVEGIKEVWSLPGEDGPRARVMVPLAADYADYPARFADLLRTLALVYDWPPACVAEQVTGTDAGGAAGR